MTFKTNYQKLSLAEPLILEPRDWAFHEWAALCKLCGLPVGPTERIVLHVNVMECFQDLSKETVDPERTYTVTEVCPHCESEIEMRWDTEKLGFKAYCPVCGKRLMLCDECRHVEMPGPCDYDNALDCCRHDPPCPSAAEEAPPAAQVDTPLGIITVKAAVDPAHPGVYIDLRRKGIDLEMPLALVEFSADDADYPDGAENLITRVWGNAMKEDYTHRAVHQRFRSISPQRGGHLTGQKISDPSLHGCRRDGEPDHSTILGKKSRGGAPAWHIILKRSFIPALCVDSRFRGMFLTMFMALCGTAKNVETISALSVSLTNSAVLSTRR